MVVVVVSDDNSAIGLYSIKNENMNESDSVVQCPQYNQEFMLSNNIHSGIISSLLFNKKSHKPDSMFLYSGGFDSIAALWEINKHNENIENNQDNQNTQVTSNILNLNQINVDFTTQANPNPNPNQIVNPPYIHQMESILSTGVACAVGDGSISILSSTLNNEHYSINLVHRIDSAHDGMVTTLTALDSNTLCSSGIDGLIKVWDIQPSNGTNSGSGPGSSKLKLNRRQRKNKFKTDFPLHIESKCECTINHGAKINMMVGSRTNTNTKNITDSIESSSTNRFFVADVSPVISIYTAQ